MNRMIPCLLLVLALAFCHVPAAAADVCDVINDLANDWNSLANDLEFYAGHDVDDLAIRRLEREVNDLYLPTEALGEDLVDLGNRREEKLGHRLLGEIDDLDDVRGRDLVAYLVDRMDDIVDALDRVVDYCDAS